ncbi:MAG: hypothetical protein HQK83_09515 [Fibrobacteria bacterium]|nr:hypothetical protein [Fibrobacteria bacterium]
MRMKLMSVVNISLLCITGCFFLFGCLADDVTGTDEQQITDVDTVFKKVSYDTTLNESITDTVMNSDDDSVSIRTLIKKEWETDSTYEIFTTFTIGSGDSVGVEEYKPEKSTGSFADTILVKSYPVKNSASISDTVVFTFVSKDTTMVESDTLLLLDVYTKTDTIITKTKSNVVFDVDDGQSIVRTSSADTLSGMIQTMDTAQLLGITGKDTNVTDTLILEQVLSQLQKFEGDLKITTTELEITSIIRSATGYTYTYEKTSWSGKVDTVDGSINIGVTADTSVDTSTIADTVNLKNNMVVATISDYSTGSYSAVSMEGKIIQTKIRPIHSDAMVRHFGGDDIYIINRMGRDNVQVINRNTLETTLQFGLPALSNPNDMLEYDDKLYFLLLADNRIRIHDKATGEYLDQIDITAYADTSDNIAEAFQGVIVKDELFVLIQNIDRNNSWAGLDAKILRIDLEENKVTATLELPFQNPNGMVYSEETFLLYVSCTGSYKEEDGGIVSVDPAVMKLVDTVVTEEKAGGNLLNLSVWENNLFMVVADGTEDHLKRTPLNTLDISTMASTGSWSFSSLAPDTKKETLYVGDRINGLRLFDLGNFTERSESKIDLGLPITSLTIVR